MFMLKQASMCVQLNRDLKVNICNTVLLYCAYVNQIIMYVIMKLGIIQYMYYL